MSDNGWTWDFNGINTLNGNADGVCTNNFHGYKDWDAVGSAQKTFSTSGSVRLEYGNCWGDGEAIVYLNGNIISRTGARSSKTIEFKVVAGDLLIVTEENGNAVLEIRSMKFCEYYMESPGKFFLVSSSDNVMI